MNPMTVNAQLPPVGLSTTQHMPYMSPTQFTTSFNPPPPFEHRNSTASRDIENFFDELASLDGAEGLETNPQFMQNLGFAPDANIADFLGSDFNQQFNPIMPPLMQPSSETATQLPSHYFEQT